MLAPNEVRMDIPLQQEAPSEEKEGLKPEPEDILAATYGISEHQEAAPELESEALPPPMTLIEQALATQPFGAALTRNLVADAVLEENHGDQVRQQRDRRSLLCKGLGLFAAGSAFTSALVATSAATGSAILKASGYAGYVIKEAAGAGATGGGLFAAHAVILHEVVSLFFDAGTLSSRVALFATDAVLQASIAALGHAIAYAKDPSMSTESAVVATVVGCVVLNGGLELSSYLYNNRYRLHAAYLGEARPEVDAEPEIEADPVMEV
jgi:hypothetical protein